MTREFVSRYANPQEGDIYLYFNDLEKRVREFNNYARVKGLDYRVRLTGDSEEYAYYAQLVLPSRETAFFSIYPLLVWVLIRIKTYLKLRKKSLTKQLCFGMSVLLNRDGLTTKESR